MSGRGGWHASACALPFGASTSWQNSCLAQAQHTCLPGQWCSQVSIAIGPAFTLGDLLKLELHKFEDEVVEIVDRSQKEEKLEQVGRRGGGCSVAGAVREAVQ